MADQLIPHYSLKMTGRYFFDGISERELWRFFMSAKGVNSLKDYTVSVTGFSEMAMPENGRAVDGLEEKCV